MISYRYLRRRSVVVNLKTDKAISGVLYRTAGRLLVLREAKLHHEGQALPIDGEAIIEVANVDFYQVLPPLNGVE